MNKSLVTSPHGFTIQIMSPEQKTEHLEATDFKELGLASSMDWNDSDTVIAQFEAVMENARANDLKHEKLVYELCLDIGGITNREFQKVQQAKDALLKIEYEKDTMLNKVDDQISAMPRAERRAAVRRRQVYLADYNKRKTVLLVTQRRVEVTLRHMLASIGALQYVFRIDEWRYAFFPPNTWLTHNVPLAILDNLTNQAVRPSEAKGAIEKRNVSCAERRSRVLMHLFASFDAETARWAATDPERMRAIASASARELERMHPGLGFDTLIPSNSGSGSRRRASWHSLASRLQHNHNFRLAERLRLSLLHDVESERLSKQHRSELDRQRAVREQCEAARAAQADRPLTRPGPSGPVHEGRVAAEPVEAHVDAKRTTRKAASQEAAAAHAREQRKKEKERLAQIEEQLRKQTLAEQIARGDLM